MAIQEKMSEQNKVRNLKVGDFATLQRTVQADDVVKMAEVSGDHNPIHIDEAYAKSTRFGRQIAHGLFCTAMVSTLLGMHLPGLGTVIISEEMRFLAPVYIGDSVTATVTVQEINYEKNKVSLSFLCTNQDNTPVMSGTTLVVMT